MRRTHLAGLDLNLLVHLEALLAEAHVTRAARRVGLSQSAMSRSLGRLRTLLGDPVLVRGRSGMELTPRARELAPPLAAALASIGELVLDQPRFDPRASTRTFTIAAADYAEALFLPALLPRLAREAPSVDLAWVSTGVDLATALEDDRVELGLGPRRPGGSRAVVWKRLFHESFVCVVRKGHPVLRARGGLTLDRFVSMPQVLVAPGGRPGSFLDDALERIGKRRRVAVRVPSFLVAPLLVAESDLVATLPARLAKRMVKTLPLRLVDPPLPLAGFDVELAWHERYRQDQGHAWVRRLVAEVAAEVAPG